MRSRSSSSGSKRWAAVIKCAECEYQRGEGPYAHYPRRDIGDFVVHAKIDRAAVPGWLVIAPRRHIEALIDLTDAEAAALGPLVKRCAEALARVTPTAKTYTASFNEALPHVHVHVIARPPSFEPPGPRIFTADSAVDPLVLETITEAALRTL
jgi:diadenosine tetraphosphate (Ap4A) HIT family hydrolase